GHRADPLTMLITSGIVLLGSKLATTPPESFDLMVFDVAWLIINPGIVIGRPPPKEPSNGSPGAMRPITPIKPPPFEIFPILLLNVQIPRSTSTILPAREPAAKAAQPLRFPPAPFPY